METRNNAFSERREKIVKQLDQLGSQSFEVLATLSLAKGFIRQGQFPYRFMAELVDAIPQCHNQEALKGETNRRAFLDEICDICELTTGMDPTVIGKSARR